MSQHDRPVTTLGDLGSMLGIDLSSITSGQFAISNNSTQFPRVAMASPPTVGIAAASTTVTGANSLNSATINIGSNANFTSPGVALINGVDYVSYTGTGATTLTGCGNHPAYTGGETVKQILSGTTNIGSAITWPATNPNSPQPLGDRFKYNCGADIGQAGTGFPDRGYVKSNSLTSTLLASAPFTASFYFTGTTLELQFKGLTSATVLVKVDDQYVNTTPVIVGATGTTYFMPLTFSTRATRRIDVILANSYWGGVNTGPLDSIAPAETRGPRCIIIGDSFTDGTGAIGGATTGWSRVMQEALGWDDVWASADGGTGYLNPGSGGRVKFRDRIDHDVGLYNPDIVIFQGGHNDYNYNPGSGVVTAAQIGAEAALCFQRVRQMGPSTLLVVLSPFWHNGPSTLPSALLAARDAIRSAALAAGGIFIDVLEMPFPLQTSPQVTTLASQAGSGSSTCSTNAPVPVRGVIQIDQDRAEVKTLGGSGPYTLTIDGTWASTHSAGATVTQVGPCLWTGTGHVGATSGYGNSDLIVSSDAIHPSQEGHELIGRTIARMLFEKLAP